MKTETDTGRNLMGQILADPLADEPRLVYADWLEETDDPDNVRHAELIRLQVAYDTLDRPRRERNAMAFRINLLIGQCRERLSRGLPWTIAKGGGSVLDPSRVVFRRGFPGQFRIHLGDWVAWGPVVAAAYPVEDVQCGDADPRGGMYTAPRGVVRGWNWNPDYERQAHGHSASIPGSVWIHLPPTAPGVDPPVRLPGWKWYANAATARAALSRALVNYARKRADLPELLTE